MYWIYQFSFAACIKFQSLDRLIQYSLIIIGLNYIPTRRNVKEDRQIIVGKKYVGVSHAYKSRCNERWKDKESWLASREEKRGWPRKVAEAKGERGSFVFRAWALVFLGQTRRPTIKRSIKIATLLITTINKSPGGRFQGRNK